MNSGQDRYRQLLYNLPYELMSTTEKAKTCIAGNREVFRQKQKIHSEELVLNGSGEERLLSITKTPKLDDNNNVEYVVCSAEDITERKRAEQQLADYTQELEQLYRYLDQEISKAGQKPGNRRNDKYSLICNSCI